MSYDSFLRGAYPVGVKSVEWAGAARGRTLPVEIYYPATAEYRGKDMDDTTKDRFTLPAAMAGEGVTRPQKRGARGKSRRR